MAEDSLDWRTLKDWCFLLRTFGYRFMLQKTFWVRPSMLLHRMSYGKGWRMTYTWHMQCKRHMKACRLFCHHYWMKMDITGLFCTRPLKCACWPWGAHRSNIGHWKQFLERKNCEKSQCSVESGSTQLLSLQHFVPVLGCKGFSFFILISVTHYWASRWQGWRCIPWNRSCYWERGVWYRDWSEFPQIWLEKARNCAW